MTRAVVGLTNYIVKYNLMGGGDCLGTEVEFLLLTQRPWDNSLLFMKMYFNVDEIYQRRWLEESEQWLENDDQTHLVLVSSKLVLQRSIISLKGITMNCKGEFRHSERYSAREHKLSNV